MKIIRPTAITDNAGSFTRSTTATYFDKDGILQTAAIDTPRVNFSYDVVLDRWKCAGVLIEPSTTNWLVRSEEFDNASWTKDAGTIVPNMTIAPNGLATADFFIPTAVTSTTHRIRQSYTAVASEHTYSIFVKAGGYDRIKLRATNAYCNFDLSTQTIGNSANITNSTLENCDNGWFRCSITTSVGFSIVYVYVDPFDTPSVDTTTFVGDGIFGIYLWGAQVEQGPLTSYRPTTSSPIVRGADIVTGTGLIYSNIAENDYSEWNAGTAYVISPTPDRVVRTTATTHAVYERVVAGTTPTAPENDPVNWIRVGPTNRWAAFDDSPSTLSSNTEYLTYILKPGAINSIALLELEGTEVAINLYADGAQQYFGYNDLLNTENIGNWYEYFYEPFYYQTNLALSDLVNASLLDLPQYGDTILCITIRKAGSTAKVGVVATGLVYELGKTQNGMSVGIVDYSKKDTDAYGNTVLVRRKFSRRIRATFFLYSSKVDVVANLLTQYRATPVVWIGADANYSSLVVYGFYRDWDIGIPNNIGSSCSIEIEGLA